MQALESRIISQPTAYIATVAKEPNEAPVQREDKFAPLIGAAKYEFACALHRLRALNSPDERRRLEEQLAPYSAMRNWNLPIISDNSLPQPISISTLRNGFVAFHGAVLQFEPLARSIARELSRTTGVDYEDCLQVGNIGLMKAIVNHPPDATALSFEYIKIRIRGEILDVLRKNSPVSRETPRILVAIRNAEGRLYERGIIEITDTLIAKEAGIKPDAIDRARREQDRSHVFSLDTEISDSEGRPVMLADTIPNGDDPEADVIKRETSEELKLTISKLPDRWQKILIYYYVNGMTMEDIASKIGVSESRVSHLHKQVMRRIRKDMGITERKEPRQALASLNVQTQEEREKLKAEAVRRISKLNLTPDQRFVISCLLESEGMILPKDEWAQKVRPGIASLAAVKVLSQFIDRIRQKANGHGISLDTVYLPKKENGNNKYCLVKLTIHGTQR